MKILITLFILLISQVSYSQEISKRIQQVVDKIEEDNMYKSSAIGYAGERTKQWDRFVKLKKNATDEELIILTNHKSPAVKCYSFHALAERKNQKTFEILLNHLKDTDVVETFQGCIVSSQSVGDFFLDVVTPNYISLSTYKLNKVQKNTVDSILLFDAEIKLAAKSYLLESINPKAIFYTRIKEIYEKENSKSALIAISKYQKQEDKELIAKWLTKEKTNDQYYGLRAVRNFPDSCFFPFIEKIQQQEIKKPTGFNYSLIRMLYLTTVQYKDKKSRELIENTLYNAKESTLEYHSEYIWLALTKYPDPIYSGIVDTIEISDFKKSEFEYWMKETDR